jgi:hypothetical protein
MAPEQHLLKRRLQILDDETRDAPRFDVHADEDSWALAVVPMKNFMARLAAFVRKSGARIRLACTTKKPGA